MAIQYTTTSTCPEDKFKIYLDNQAGLYRLKPLLDHSNQVYHITAIKSNYIHIVKNKEIVREFLKSSI